MEYCTNEVLANYVNSWNFETMVQECQENFSSVPFLKLYFHSLSQNTLLSMTLILIISIISFLNIKYIADNFFTLSIKNIKNRFQISSIVTSCVVIPIINGAPDLICSVAFGEKANGLQTAVGCLIASFVFSILVIIGFVIRSSKKQSIKISKSLYFKELVFYLLSLSLLISFGIYGKITNFLATGFLLLYLVYLGITFWWMKPDEFDNLSDVFVAYEKESKQKNIGSHYSASYITELKDQVFGKQFSLTSTVASPFKLIYGLTVPSKDNKFMNSNFVYLVYFLSTASTLVAFNIFNNPVLIVFSSYSLVTILGLVGRHKENEHVKHSVCEILTLFVSIAWIKVICAVLMDAILFLSFLININQIYLSIFIISIGNSLQDLFSNISLSSMGFEQIAIISTFSGQLCNLLIGLWLNSIISGNKSFVLFDSGFNKKGSEFGNLLIFYFLLSAVAVVFGNSVYFTMNDFEYRKNYFGFGVFFYFVFIAASILHIWLDSKEIR